MSDHDAAPDPIDDAYRRAEAVLADERARAARRTQVLAAVAREAQALEAPQAAPTAMRHSGRRLGGALAAAAVAGLSVLLATHLRQGSPFQPEASHASAPGEEVRAAPSTATPSQAAAPPSPSPTAPRQAVRSGASGARDGAGPPQSHPGGDSRAPDAAADVAAAPPPSAAMRVEEPAAPNSTVVTARRRAESLSEQPAAGAPPREFAGKAAVERSTDPAERLGDAAAAGRIGEVRSLLEQGVPVDAADANGETALMRSIRADQPAVAALLRQRGASLERENRSGESARDIADGKNDARLDQALGLDP